MRKNIWSERELENKKERREKREKIDMNNDDSYITRETIIN